MKKTNQETAPSFYEDLKEMNDTIVESRNLFYQPQINNDNDEIHTIKNQKMKRNIKKTKPKKNRTIKKENNQIELDIQQKQPKMLDFLKFTNFSGREAKASDIGTAGLNDLLNNQLKNNQGRGNFYSGLDTDYYEEICDKESVKQIIYKNDIRKIDQKISVNNYNCSCSIF